MATFTKSGSVSSAVGLNTNPSVSLSGTGTASGIINSVVALLYMSTNAYSNTYNVTVTLYYSGGSVSASGSVKFTSTNYSGAQFSFSFATGFDVNSITSMSVSASSNGNLIFLKNNQSVTVTYTVPSNTGAPSSVSLASAVSTGSTNTLYWSGASAGTANSISGYKIQYRDQISGSWGSWTDYTTVNSSSSSGSMTVNMPATGRYRQFRVLTMGSAGSSYYSGYRESGTTYAAYTPTSPANLLPAAGAYGSVSAISWGAVTSPDTIAGYQYQISQDGGSTWGSAVSTTANSINIASTFAAAPTSARFVFRVRAYTNQSVYSGYATSGVFYRVAAPVAPTVFTATPANYESGNIALAWSGASDEDNNITRYEIQFATSANGSTWSDYTALKTVSTSSFSGSTTDAPVMDRGTYRKYRIRAVDASGYSSAWKESGAVYRQHVATPPINLNPHSGFFETAPTLTWGASTAPDGNLAGYEYQISQDGGATWGTARTTTGTSAALSEFSDAPRGTAFVFRVRAYTSLGAYSDYGVSGVFYKNTAPTAPVIQTPTASVQVRNTGAWAIVACTAKSNGIPQTLEYRIGSGAWTTLAHTIEGNFSRAVRITSQNTYTFRVTDSAGATAQSSLSFTISALVYTDSSIVAGTTPTRAAHINEMRAVVASLRAAYGMSEASWSESIYAGTTSLRHFNDHILELRESVAAIVARLNSVAGFTVVSLAAWAALADNGPKAVAIMELRAAIAKV